MYRRARLDVLVVSLCFVASTAAAQAVWQPTPPPLVTAENETWYRAGSPIEWNGDFYYRAGAPQAFDPYVMVRAGSYRGIPLYTDTTLEPYSIVFVPISGTRMQPYERVRAGMLADTTGSRTPWFPPQTSAALDLMAGGFVAQAPAPPMFARPYDLAPPYPRPEPYPEAAPPVPVAAGGATTAPQPTGTGGQLTDYGPVSTAIPPTGINTAWIEYDSQRWVADGKAVARTQDMREIGEYHGFPVYERGADRSTIYVPSTADLVVPFTRR
jgi:hypothetical protein